MGKGIVIFLIFVVLIGIFAYVYLRYQKPVNDNKEQVYANLSIQSIYNNTPVSTNYEIIINGVNETGKTFEEGFVRRFVPVNSTIILRNVNDSYYEKRIEIFIDRENVYRMILDLEKVGNITINSSINPFNPGVISLNITSKDTFKNYNLCSKWTLHILSISLENYTGERTDNYDRCFRLEGYLNDSETQYLTLNYDAFGVLDEKDKIELFFIDEKNNTVLYNINNIYKIQ